MNVHTRAFVLTAFVVVNLLIGQTQANSKRKSTTNPANEEDSGQEIGKSYSRLRPEQRRLVDDHISHYNQTTGSKVVPQEAYDNARLSVRTTFDAVTHALLKAKLADAKGNNLGRAIDLVDAVDEVMGQESGAGGDRQFRVYVYLTAIHTK